jgi:hypothetical protein
MSPSHPTFAQNAKVGHPPHTISNVGIFAGFETPSKTAELQVNVHADVVAMGSCPQ